MPTEPYFLTPVTLWPWQWNQWLQREPKDPRYQTCKQFGKVTGNETRWYSHTQNSFKDGSTLSKLKDLEWCNFNIFEIVQWHHLKVLSQATWSQQSRCPRFFHLNMSPGCVKGHVKSTWYEWNWHDSHLQSSQVSTEKKSECWNDIDFEVPSGSALLLLFRHTAHTVAILKSCPAELHDSTRTSTWQALPLWFKYILLLTYWHDM